MEYEKVKKAAETCQDIFSSYINWYYIMTVSILSHLPDLLMNTNKDKLDDACIWLYLAQVAISMLCAMRVNVKVIYLKNLNY